MWKNCQTCSILAFLSSKIGFAFAKTEAGIEPTISGEISSSELTKEKTSSKSSFLCWRWWLAKFSFDGQSPFFLLVTSLEYRLVTSLKYWWDDEDDENWQLTILSSLLLIRMTHFDGSSRNLLSILITFYAQFFIGSFDRKEIKVQNYGTSA